MYAAVRASARRTPALSVLIRARCNARRALSTAPAASDPRARRLIEEAVKKSDLVLFMKGTPGFPKCGFSRLVVQILELYGLEDGRHYKAIDVLEDEDVRAELKRFSNWPTIPQVYLKGEFVGGADIMRSLYESGELKAMLQPLLKGHEGAAKE